MFPNDDSSMRLSFIRAPVPQTHLMAALQLPSDLGRSETLYTIKHTLAWIFLRFTLSDQLTGRYLHVRAANLRGLMERGVPDSSQGFMTVASA